MSQAPPASMVSGPRNLAAPAAFTLAQKVLDQIIPAAQASDRIDQFDRLIVCVCVSGDSYDISVHRNKFFDSFTINLLYSKLDGIFKRRLKTKYGLLKESIAWHCINNGVYSLPFPKSKSWVLKQNMENKL